MCGDKTSHIKNLKGGANMRILINHSNHPSESWSEEQKMRWSKIIDIPFPKIDPEYDNAMVYALVYKNIEEIKKILEVERGVKYIYVAGEYSYCYLFILNIKKKLPNVTITIPTTKREAKEIKKEDGSIEKTSIFKFVGWRNIKP